MSDTCPTVKIKSAHASGYAVINESDFDAARHELFAELPPPPPPVELPPPPPPPPAGPLDNLPPNWRKKEPAELRTLAASATGRTPEDKKQAIEMIEAALAASKETK